jgi:hypothetical protein
MLLACCLARSSRCHIHADGHCCGKLKSNFLAAPPRKIMLVEPKRHRYNFCVSSGEETEFHINNQSGFSGNGIPVK